MATPRAKMPQEDQEHHLDQGKRHPHTDLARRQHPTPQRCGAQLAQHAALAPLDEGHRGPEQAHLYERQGDDARQRIGELVQDPAA